MVVPCFKLDDMYETLGRLKEAGEIDRCTYRDS